MKITDTNVKKTMLMALLAATFAASCSSSDDPEPTLSVSPTSLQFEATGNGSANVDVQSNTKWTMTTTESWLSLSQRQGSGNATVEINVAEDNPEPVSRTAEITVTAGDLIKTIRATQKAGLSLSVSPSDPQLSADKGASVNFEITTNSSWSISGIPEWISLTATQGTGNTSITITTTEKNFSEKERTAELTVSAGNKTAKVKVIQAPSFADIHVNTANEITMSDGWYADLVFDKNVLGYHEAYYQEYALSVKTEEDIYNEVLEETSQSAKETAYAVGSDFTPGKNYIYCCIPYTGDGKSRKYGPMLIKRFTTKSSSNYCDALVTAKYSYPYWRCNISKQKRCHHYYRLLAVNESADFFNIFPSILLAKEINEWINDKVNHPNYDYYLNDGTTNYTKESDEYSFLIWTWGVDDNNEFSGNISKAYASTGSNAKTKKNVKFIAPQGASKAKSFKKPKTAEIEKFAKGLRVMRR